MYSKIQFSSFKVLVLVLTMALLSVCCHRGTGCPAEDAHVKTDKKGNPKGKTTSGLFDKKGRMNSSGYKSDRRKPKKHSN